MIINDFKNLIWELPIKEHSFEISLENWEVSNQNNTVNKIFGSNKSVVLNRFDLTNSINSLEQFVIKTLMWGYPTKGRGENINRLLEPENFKLLISLLEKYPYNEISLEQFTQDLKTVPSLGISTLSKFAYFLETKIDGLKSLILDRKIIKVINSNRFDELKELNGIRYNNVNQYYEYLKIMNRISKELDVEAEKIELFLFIFGNNLSKINGEEFHDEVD